MAVNNQCKKGLLVTEEEKHMVYGRLKPKIYALESFVAFLKTQNDTKTNQWMDLEV